MSDRTDSFYAAESAVHGYGAQIEVGDGASPEAFEAIAGVTNIKPGEVTKVNITPPRTSELSTVTWLKVLPGGGGAPVTLTLPRTVERLIRKWVG